VKKIIITGSEGFIGKHLVAYFSSLDFKVYGCDILEPSANVGYTYFKISISSPQWDEIFSAVQFDYCINASGSGNVSFSVTDPLADFQLNTLDTFRILDAIRKYSGECRYLHISSAAVYGNPEFLPVTETVECKPLSPYGWHKLMAEEVCKEFHSLYGLQLAIVRPFSVYGPGLRKQLFWDVFQKHKANKSQVMMWGTGKESRDFIHIDDLVHSFHLILENGDMKVGIYNVASGLETSIEEVLQLFFKLHDDNCEVQFNQQNRLEDPLNWKADISKIRNLDFDPSISLHIGMQQLVQWMKSLRD